MRLASALAQKKAASVVGSIPAGNGSADCDLCGDVTAVVGDVAGFPGKVCAHCAVELVLNAQGLTLHVEKVTGDFVYADEGF